MVVSAVEEFAQQVVAQVATARAHLAAAAASADHSALAAALDELEQAHAAAREAGVTIPPAQEAKEKDR